MNPIRLDNSIPQLLQVLTKASLEGLNAGDILQGRVQSLENSMLLLKLLDGAFFTAKVPDGFSASPGELVTLEIGEKQNDQLTARIIPTDSNTDIAKQTGTQSQNQLQPAMAADIEQKLTNLGVAKTNQLIDSVIKLLDADPKLPVDNAVFMAANKMPSDPELQKMLQKFSEHEFEIQTNLQTLKEGLTSTLSQKDPIAGSTLLKPLAVSQGLENLEADLKTIMPSEYPKVKDAILQNVRELLNKTLLSEMDGSVKAAETIDPKAVENLIKTAMSAEAGKTPEQTAEALKLPPLIDPRQMTKLIETINKAIEDIHTKTKAIDQGDKEQTIKIVEKLFEKAQIKSQSGIADDFDLKEKTKALKDIMDFTQKAVSHMDSKSQEAVLPAFKEIDSAFKFMNQVTTYDSVVQLPLKINQQNTTGELFVMKRKNGRKKLDANNFTLFLSLQTNSLGRIETFLNASQKYVTISFRVEQDDLIKLVKENHRALYDGLIQKGYKLAEMKCRIIEKEDTSILNAVKKAQDDLGLESSVDIKI